MTIDDTMLQKMLMYYLESNFYFLDKIEILSAMLHDFNDEINLQILKIAQDKLKEQGGRYILHLKNSEIKKYLCFRSDDKCACVIFSIWLGLDSKSIKELTSYKKKDIYSKCIDVIRKSIKNTSK